MSNNYFGEGCPDLYADIFGPLFNEESLVLPAEADKHYGVFPVKASIFENGSVYVKVYPNESTIDDYEAEYCDDKFTVAALTNLYIGGGIVHAGLRQLIDPNDMEHIEHVYHTLTSADSLSRQVLDSVDDEDVPLGNVEVETMLLALRSGWLVPDLALINASRLAISIFSDIGGDEYRETTELMKDATRCGLKDTLNRWEPYKNIMRALGDDDVLNIAPSFANAIPSIEVIGSFPMSTSEAVAITQIISKK